MLHWEKAKVNEEDLPKDKEAAKKPVAKKPAPKKALSLYINFK